MPHAHTQEPVIRAAFRVKEWSRIVNESLVTSSNENLVVSIPFPRIRVLPRAVPILRIVRVNGNKPKLSHEFQQLFSTFISIMAAWAAEALRVTAIHAVRTDGTCTAKRSDSARGVGRGWVYRA